MSDLPSFSRDDIRYAAEMTRVVYEPDRRIDTFGDTRFNFLLLSELMDEVNVVRVRSGWVEAEKPKIIRPSIYNTALLPAIDPQEPSRVIGTSTVEAMQSGAVYGYRGLVKEILARLEGELGVRPAVVATGGDAALIARGVERIDHVDPDITLNGLRIAAGLNL